MKHHGRPHPRLGAFGFGCEEVRGQAGCIFTISIDKVKHG